jgi:GNAT superfamily N-acetyltransferase
MAIRDPVATSVVSSIDRQSLRGVGFRLGHRGRSFGALAALDQISHGFSFTFKAESRGELVGCAFITRWGSSALFGPLAVHPDHWDQGVGRLLWEARLPLLDRWGTTLAALFTRAETMNLHLYQKVGFWPGFLTALTA